ncbi:hypothetical protein CI109_102125 [Kwoniella shandongensis]|uniref:Uncharacterized protein n=1 Tax=Kwoniella shandongensis TaxID=1734106 RepID=A0A5M6C0J4_9TREE|nr:uncharacterized protein CI109_003715 [Kwoniella shandongensis]KAA5528060.1 hypothetical protein CI109_003715 [Kwoniella shandongensis]
MDPNQPYDGILEDETLAPLKRNHACLQCKKRKVKCDAIRPTCSPCLRSHAHAIRSANRNQTPAPPLCCTYAEGDSPEPTPPREREEARRQSSTGGGGGGGAGVKRVAQEQGKRPRTTDDEKEMLKARIAELESRLAGLTPPSDTASLSGSSNIPSISRESGQSNDHWASNFDTSARTNNPAQPTYLGGGATLDDKGSSSWTNNVSADASALPDDLGEDWVNNLFLVPNNWPKGLPSPFLLEHLIETFFTCVPLTPRMLHRASLLARIKLPPTSPDFPYPGLLHAICASASAHTAWVNNLAPHLLEVAVQQHILAGLDMTSIEDFGLAQAAAAARSVDLVASICMMGGGSLIFQLAQTAILLSDVYFHKGFPLKGWMFGSQPARLINLLDIWNRQPKKSHKEPIMPPPVSSQEREERLVTVWMAYLNDAGYAANSTYAPSMNFSEIRCALPTSMDEWKKTYVMQGNPQTPDSEDLFSSHPVPDSFVLVVKASILLGSVAKWIRDWGQTEPESEAGKLGMQSESFKQIVRDIETFKSSLPAALKNVFRMMDATKNGNGSFDENLLAIHIIPNICMCLLHEPFLEWNPQDPALNAVQKAYEGIIGTLHLIPSNLDVTVVFTPMMTFSLYTIGRVVADFVSHALSRQEYSVAMRHRADLQTIQNLLDRIGQRYALGNAMSHFLENYVRLNGERKMEIAQCSSTAPRQLTWNGAVERDIRESATNNASNSFSNGNSGMGIGTYAVCEPMKATQMQSQTPSSGSLSGSNSGISPAVCTPISVPNDTGSTKSNQLTPSENGSIPIQIPMSQQVQQNQSQQGSSDSWDPLRWWPLDDNATIANDPQRIQDQHRSAFNNNMSLGSADLGASRGISVALGSLQQTSTDPSSNFMNMDMEKNNAEMFVGFEGMNWKPYGTDPLSGGGE